MATFLSPKVQSIFHPPYNPLKQSISHQFGSNDTMGDHAKDFPKVKVGNITSSIELVISLQQSIRLLRHNSSLVKGIKVCKGC